MLEWSTVGGKRRNKSRQGARRGTAGCGGGYGVLAACPAGGPARSGGGPAGGVSDARRRLKYHSAPPTAINTIVHRSALTISGSVSSGHSNRYCLKRSHRSTIQCQPVCATSAERMIV